MPIFFSIKIVAGFVLYYIYNHFYENRGSGDVNKYFDDALVIYKAIGNNYMDYFKIVFNINCNAPQMFHYFKEIDHWEVYGNTNFVNDARTVIRFNLLLLPISKGFYHFHSVVLNFISFIGLVFIYTTFCKINIDNKKRWAAICFLLPSLLFWCSGVLKEGLLIFFIGLFVHVLYILSEGIEERKYINFLWLIISLIGVFITKFYVAFALLPLLFFYAFRNKKNISHTYKVLAFYLLILLVLFVDSVSTKVILNPLAQKQKEFVNVAKGGYYFEVKSLTAIDTLYVEYINEKYLKKLSETNYEILKNCPVYFYDNLEILSAFKNKTKIENAYLLKVIVPANSYIYLPAMQSRLSSLLEVLPIAIYNTLFLPTFFSIKNLMYLMPAFENLLFIILLFFAFFNGKKITKKQEYYNSLFLVFAINLIVLIGLITPVLGALIRYKVPVLPFLFFVLISKIDFTTSDNKNLKTNSE